MGGVLLISILIAVLHPVSAQNTDGSGPDIIITGTVTDEQGQPLTGVYVFVENTSSGTITDLDGKYSIKLKPDVKTLVFSFIGFDTQKIPLTARSTEINVVLAEEAQSLDEVVVVGYGVQKKESSVAAIGQVNGEDLSGTNTTSIAGALQGQMPGVSVIQNSGAPGADNTRIMIRGVSSWVSSDPLVLVDGVERDYNNIDPSEIETMSVLKDASATAVFGVRGANGVILITTKRGKSGAVKVQFSSEVGMKSPINMKAPMDSYTTALVINEARKNDNDWGAILSDEVV